MAGVAMSYGVPALCFVGVALYAWLGSEPEPEELAADPAVGLG
jgi:MFS transporter, FHS family, L-fucose permease